MGAKSGRPQKKRKAEYCKLNYKERALVRNVWIFIENNPQSHGKAFFFGLFKKYPQYMKYFMTEPKSPLIIDARITAKFTVIVETLGYLVLGFPNKPKQLDQLVGYIAMVHKDMLLDKTDLNNLGQELLGYLEESFPALMTPECVAIFTKYLMSVLEEMSIKMEEQRTIELPNAEEVTKEPHHLLKPCARFTNRTDRLVFGQTTQYWQARKRDWDERIAFWKLNQVCTMETVKIVIVEDFKVPSEAVGNPSVQDETDSIKLSRGLSDNPEQQEATPVSTVPYSVISEGEISEHNETDVSEPQEPSALPPTLDESDRIDDETPTAEITNDIVPQNNIMEPEGITNDQKNYQKNDQENQSVDIKTPRERHRFRESSAEDIISIASARPEEAVIKDAPDVLPVVAITNRRPTKLISAWPPPGKMKSAGIPCANSKKKIGKAKCGQNRNDTRRVSKPETQQLSTLAAPGSSARQRRRASLERQRRRASLERQRRRLPPERTHPV